MANNRIYIKCNVCGEYVSIAKSFGGAFEPVVNIERKLFDFMKKHAWCGPAESEGDFDLAYEFAPDGEEAREID